MSEPRVTRWCVQARVSDQMTAQLYVGEMFFYDADAAGAEYKALAVAQKWARDELDWRYRDDADRMPHVAVAGVRDAPLFSAIPLAKVAA